MKGAVNMISEKMYQLGSKRSVIRELFEYGKKGEQKSDRKMSLTSVLEIQMFRHQLV